MGKYSVGSELAASTGFRLVHNHLTINAAVSVFEFDSPPMMRLVAGLRRMIFAAAAEEDVDLVITGVLTGQPEDFPFWAGVLEPIREAGGELLLVQLRCDRVELNRRIQTESRIALGKTVNPAFLDEYDLVAAFPEEGQLKLDTTHMTVRDAADRVIRHFGLSVVTRAAVSDAD